MTRISLGQHPDSAGTSPVIPWSLMSLRKCTLTESRHWDPGPHNAPVQFEEARVVTGPFPNDLGPHGWRQGMVNHEPGVNGPKI